MARTPQPINYAISSVTQQQGNLSIIFALTHTATASLKTYNVVIPAAALEIGVTTGMTDSQKAAQLKATFEMLIAPSLSDFSDLVQIAFGISDGSTTLTGLSGTITL